MFYFICFLHFYFCKNMISYQILSRKKRGLKNIYSKFNKILKFMKQIRLIELWQKYFEKKKNKSRTFDTEPNLYLFVYTSMLILNFHLIEINNWQHLLQQGLFWQNFISPIYMCRYISHCLASPHLAKKKTFVLCIAKTAAPLAIEPFVARHPSIHQSNPVFPL